jgi:glycosyltransferase involved in cell wall biosynthesis
MNLADITPLILTYNEAPNIGRVLSYLEWADQIIVVDSYSGDETIDILSSYPQVKLFQRQFDTHAQQWNYGLDQISTEWVLSLDSDYLILPHLRAEIEALPQHPSMDGYFAPFKYCVLGKPLRGTILPPRQVLFRKQRSHYIDDGHTQLLQVDGVSAMLQASIYHDDRKPLSRWLWAQSRYMVIEAKKLLETPDQELSWGDRIRPLLFWFTVSFSRAESWTVGAVVTMPFSGCWLNCCWPFKLLNTKSFKNQNPSFNA